MRSPSNKTYGKDSLQHLRKGGPNGLVTLLLGLRWWHMIMDGEGLADWNTIVEQVHGIFVENNKRKSNSR